MGREVLPKFPDAFQEVGDGIARHAEPPPAIERSPCSSRLEPRGSNPPAKRVSDLGIDQVRNVQLLLCQRVPGRARVKQSGERCRRVWDDHRSERPASKSAIREAGSTSRSGRVRSSTGLSTRRDTSSSSLTATADTDIRSRAASRSRRSTTSSGTLRM